MIHVTFFNLKSMPNLMMEEFFLLKLLALKLAMLELHGCLWGHIKQTWQIFQKNKNSSYF